MATSPSRRKGLIAAAITVLLIGSAVVTLNALRGAHPASGMNTSLACKQRLTWVPTDTAASLRAVVALSQSDGWAVGASSTGAVVMRWNGSRWSEVAAPAPDGASSALDAIAAVSARDIWAVGSAGPHPLILHWDGAVWSQVQPAPLTAYSSQLSALAVVAPDDVWAVGNAWQTASGTPHAIAERWDGHSWKTAPAPTASAFSSLTAYPGATDAAVWGLLATPAGNQRLVRWDGRAWQELPMPDPSAKGLDLQALAAGPHGAVWAAGSYYSADAASPWAVPIVEHWDGTAWSRVPTSETESRGAWLTSLAVGSDGTLWAAGSLRNPNTRLMNAFMEHVTDPKGTTSAFGLYPSIYTDPHRADSFGVMGIAAVPGATAAWVVGTTGSVPDSSRPPIDSNLPVASGAFMLAYC